MQVRCVAMPEPVQRADSPRDDVGPSRIHLHAPPSLLRVLQCGILRTGIGGARRLLPPRAGLLRVQVRHSRPPRPHVDPQIQRLSQALEEVPALPARVLRRHSIAPRQHMPAKSHPMSAEMRRDDAASFGVGRTSERRLQGVGRSLLVQGRRLSLQGPEESPRLTPRSERRVASLVNGATVVPSGPADFVAQKRRRQVEYKLHRDAVVEDQRLAREDG